MCTGAEILLLSGSALAGVGAVQAGQAADKQAKLQASALQQQSAREKQQAAADEADFRREQARLMGTRRAILGGAGVRLDTGSPLLTSEDFASEVELQALRIREGGEIRATRLQQQAQLERAAGRAARTGGFLRGGSLLLSGAGKTFA